MAIELGEDGGRRSRSYTGETCLTCGRVRVMWCLVDFWMPESCAPAFFVRACEKCGSIWSDAAWNREFDEKAGG